MEDLKNSNESTAVGAHALENNEGNGCENSAFGAYSGENVASGTFNSLFSNWTSRFNDGNRNSIFGYKSFAGTDPSSPNSAPSLPYGSANDCTVMGCNAMQSILNGFANTAIGSSSAASVRSESNVTLIGYNTDIKANANITNATALGSNSVANASYATAIGAGSVVNSDNSIVLGRVANGVAQDFVGIGTTMPLTGLQIESGIAVHVERITTSVAYVATAKDYMIIMNDGNPATVTLPGSSSTPGRTFIVKNMTGAPLTINSTGSNFMNAGPATTTITLNNNQTATLIHDPSGPTYHVVSLY